MVALIQDCDLVKWVAEGFSKRGRCSGLLISGVVGRVLMGESEGSANWRFVGNKRKDLARLDKEPGRKGDEGKREHCSSDIRDGATGGDKVWGVLLGWIMTH